MIDSTNKPPAIDIDMLTMALQAGDLETNWWLDSQSGDVIPAPEPDGDESEQKLIRKKQRSPDRFIEIEPISSSVYCELMESYIATLEGAVVCEALYEALQRKQPSWHFKKALAEEPECEDNWYAFKDQFYALQARQWLRDRDMEYKEYLAETTPASNKLFAPGATQTCLELKIGTSEQRRYIIWLHEQQISLTVFTVVGNSEQLLAETQINEHQLSGINRTMASYQPGIDARPERNMMDAYVSYSSVDANGEVHGRYAEGSLFQRLAEMFDMLLGIPVIKE